jgi:hypothetical protein
MVEVMTDFGITEEVITSLFSVDIESDSEGDIIVSVSSGRMVGRPTKDVVENDEGGGDGSVDADVDVDDRVSLWTFGLWFKVSFCAASFTTMTFGRDWVATISFELAIEFAGFEMESGGMEDEDMEEEEKEDVEVEVVLVLVLLLLLLLFSPPFPSLLWRTTSSPGSWACVLLLFSKYSSIAGSNAEMMSFSV